MIPSLLLALAASSALAAVPEPPVLVVEETTPVERTCDASDALVLALRRALPHASVVPRAPLGSRSLTASLRFDDDAWSLTVAPAGEAPVLSRVLPGSEADCAAAASAASVIVRRYLTELAGSSKAEVALAPLPPPPPLVRALSLGVGLTARAPVDVTLAAGVALAGSARVGGVGFLQIGGTLALPKQTSPVVIDGIERGALYARRYAGWLAAGACLGGGATRSVCAAPLAGVYVLDGGAEGELFQKRSQRLTVPLVGALVDVDQPLAAGFFVGATVRAGVPLGRPALGVEGTSMTVGVPTVDLQAGLRLGWSHAF